MPLTINEIGIKMQVDDTAAPPEQAAAGDAAAPKAGVEDGCGPVDREQLVHDTVQRVLMILRQDASR